MVLVVVVVQLSSGCGRNEWNAAVGQGSSGGEEEGALRKRRRRWQSCSVRTTTRWSAVVSQDGIGRINMAVESSEVVEQGGPPY